MIFLQRLAWSTMSLTSSASCVSSSQSSSSRLACSRRMPSGLLTSWAMPAASWPMLASFSLLTSASLVVSSEMVGLLQLVDGLAQLLDGVGQAHLDLGQALPDGDGVVAAGVVAAGAAVELVLGAVLVHAREDLLELLVASACRRSAGRTARRCARGRRRRTRRRPPPRPARSKPAWRARVTALTSERRLKTGVLAAEAGAHDAALAAEDVEQPRLGLAVLEVGDGVDEVLARPSALTMSPLSRSSSRFGRLQQAAR